MQFKKQFIHCPIKFGEMIGSIQTCYIVVHQLIRT